MLQHRLFIFGSLVATIAIVAVPGLAISNSLHGDNFILPSDNIACNFWENKYLRCDLKSGLKPRPKSTCDLDWTGISLGRVGSAKPTCAGDTVFGSHPVLNYGSTWTRSGMKCTATTAGLTCQSPSGHGFFLSKEQWRTY